MKKNYIIPTFVCVELKGETICAESVFSLEEAQGVSDIDLDTKGEKNEWKSLWDDAW